LTKATGQHPNIKYDVRYFPKGFFPSGNFLNITVSQAATSQVYPSLRRLRGPNLTFGKLLLGKLHVREVDTWEVATWEIVTWEVASGKKPLGKYLKYD